MQRMVRQLLFVGANGTMRPLMISLPLVEPLLDGVRYFRFEDQPEAPGSKFHVGKPSREKLAQALRPRIPRGPSLRSMVRAAVERENAREFDRLIARERPIEPRPTPSGS